MNVTMLFLCEQKLNKAKAEIDVTNIGENYREFYRNNI